MLAFGGISQNIKNRVKFKMKTVKLKKKKETTVDCAKI